MPPDSCASLLHIGRGILKNISFFNGLEIVDSIIIGDNYGVLTGLVDAATRDIRLTRQCS